MSEFNGMRCRDIRHKAHCVLTRASSHDVCIESRPMWGSKRHFIVWMTGLGLLWSALLPLWAPAFRQVDASPTLVICTAMGMKTIATPAPQADGSSSSSSPKDGMPGSCPLCCLHWLTLALPVMPIVLALPVRLGGLWVAPLFLHAPRPLFVWASAQPRAPPLTA
jgi:hypothetical protein